MNEHVYEQISWIGAIIVALGGGTGVGAIIKTVWDKWRDSNRDAHKAKRENRDAVIKEWERLTDRLGERIQELEAQLERAQDKITAIILENARLKGDE